MDPAHYTDPLEDALSHASQRVAQVASLTGAMAQVIMQRRALADARRSMRGDDAATQALDGQERILRQQARLSWAPAHDKPWLAQADLSEVARAWAGAAAWADSDPSAASALRKCEDRLRELHPHAMARYDRLRADGVDSLSAMREAAPLFALAPTARPGDPSPAPPARKAGPGHDERPLIDRERRDMAEAELTEEDPDPAELRGRQIADRLQARARAAGRPELGPHEMAIVLETVTNLPDDVIVKLTRQGDTDAAGLSRRATRSAAQLASENFPHTAAAAVRAAAAASSRSSAPGQALSRSQPPPRTTRPGRSR